MTDYSMEESIARCILATLLGHSWTGRHALTFHAFVLQFGKRGWNRSDFDRGIRFAAQRRWVEVSFPTSFRLTEAGFAEACKITAEKAEGAQHVKGERRGLSN